MPDFVTVPDPVAGDRDQGQIRVERRDPAQPDGSPPLLLIGGMTQTVASWGAHLRPLSHRRTVVAYETRGQGSTELDVNDCTPARHVEDFVSLVDALGLPTPLDLCGFSFGGRLALAIAVARPDLIRRLVISGVAHERGVVGALIVRSWIQALRTGDLETLAWVSLPDILGAPYLEKNAHLIEGMVKTTVQRNRYEGIKALFDQTMDLPDDSRWHPSHLAAHIHMPSLLMSGELDRIAPPAEVRALASALGAELEVFPGAGHTVPIEAPAPWRERMERFLDAPG